MDGNAYNYYDSNGNTGSGTLTLGATATVAGNAPPGPGGQYTEYATRIIAASPLVASSTNDGNGTCRAPRMPTAMLKTKFAVNVDSNWAAFASIASGIITRTNPGGRNIRL
ncbi:MAG: hypothetical protein R2827_13100 [Bdellovibrionales bacterium]